MSVVLFQSSIKCSDCGEEFTPEQMRKDEVRIHKMRDGQLLCECCHEDYMEKFCSCEED
jgi:formylmethanofuran dehydrogenase subunit E